MEDYKIVYHLHKTWNNTKFIKTMNTIQEVLKSFKGFMYNAFTSHLIIKIEVFKKNKKIWWSNKKFFGLGINKLDKEPYKNFKELVEQGKYLDEEF